MQRTGRMSVVAAVAAVTALVAIPVTAQAATKTVSIGTTAAAQKALQSYGADANDFFPHGVTIHVGDSVKFLAVGLPHVDLPKKGGTFLPLLTAKRQGQRRRRRRRRPVLVQRPGRCSGSTRRCSRASTARS